MQHHFSPSKKSVNLRRIFNDLVDLLGKNPDYPEKEIAEEYPWYIKCIINIAKVLIIADKYDILSVGSYKAERAML